MQMPLDRLGDELSRLASDDVTPHRLPRLHQIEQELRQRGAGKLVEELRKRDVPPDQWEALFEHAWMFSCLDRIRAEDQSLEAFSGKTHGGYVEEFRKLDQERLRIARDRVQRAYGERAVDTMNRLPQQTELIRREAKKKARHLPLRRLLADAPAVLTAISPCWMASPLSVSQLLDAKHRYFDVVIFDEASQVLPEDAVPAILRADQIVVAGDPHQLPPTPFFEVQSLDPTEEADAADEVEGFESILDIMSSFLPSWMLEWHYRSRDERLIAFSNQHIYQNRLVTFPGTGGGPCIQHVLVPSRTEDAVREESPSPEVHKVVELILEHAKNRPTQTLGVIAMGLRHARRIQAALDAALSEQSDLDEFFSETKQERSFIKNLERVQGDERDAIILSVGYGKDATGRLLYRFGPLNNREYGHRRLNVAITRARRRMTIVSSFGHHDMDPSLSRSRGVDLLRHYLEYAQSGGALLSDSGETTYPLNSFEADVYEALTAAGIPLIPQWGCSGYRIDLAAKHPKQPGRLVLAIECDGATYHAVPTARDRDRLRQQHLEALGWTFHRIWSTDWFMNREAEIQSATKAYEGAVRAADGNADIGHGPASPEPSSHERHPSRWRLAPRGT
jgi:very-short-patch-repair endonuclease